MITELGPEIREVIQAVHYKPAVSIIMPFEPKMGIKAEITQQLKIATDKVEKQLAKNYPDELATLVIQKLRNIIKTLNFSTFKKSIAIYVSPVFEKVLYLDIPVEEKIIIDESFEIRDLVYAKKELHKYLVLVLSGKWSKIYLGNGTQFIRIKFDKPDNIAAYVNDTPERVSNFSDPSHRKETVLKKFLHYTDEGLRQLLKAYPLPVFVLGTDKTLGYFKSLTRHDKNIVGIIQGNYEEASEPELARVLAPYVEDWKKVKQTDLFHQLENAAGAGKLASGIKEVWKQACQHKGRLLVVEKNYMYPTLNDKPEDISIKLGTPYNKFSYIKDAVDDIIEKVLEDGGDVEFVDEDLLLDYNRIVLVQYY